VTRPALHYAPPSGWVNDPLALTFHDGRYHLFFQYVPESTVWTSSCRWGHATSDDLLTWHTEPVALEPGDGEDGVWSGNLVRPAPGETVVFYTAVDEADREIGRVRRAVPLDDEWVKWDKEGVVVGPPTHEDLVAFRDPFVYRDGETWRMLLGGGVTPGDGVAWMYTSTDLCSWTYSGRAVSRSGEERGPIGGDWTGSVWECPILVEVGGRLALVISVWVPGIPNYVAYAFVEADGDRLVPGDFRRLTYGPSLYAASTFTDADGEPGLIAWLREVGDPEAGWMGAHSLPYRVAISGDLLVVRPHPALLDRRAGQVMGELLPAVADLEWAAKPGDVLVAGDLFRLDAVGETVAVTVGDARHELPWAGEPLRVVVDGPVLEVFGDRGVLAVPLPATGRDGVLTGDTERVVVHRLG